MNGEGLSDLLHQTAHVVTDHSGASAANGRRRWQSSEYKVRPVHLLEPSGCIIANVSINPHKMRIVVQLDTEALMFTVLLPCAQEFRSSYSWTPMAVCKPQRQAGCHRRYTLECGCPSIALRSWPIL